MYVTHSYEGPHQEDVKLHAKEVRTDLIRKMLRFYHQIGILLDKGLIDADFIFQLIGDGLKTSEQGIKVATEWHQNYYGGENLRTRSPPPGPSMNKQKISLTSIGSGKQGGSNERAFSSSDFAV